MTVMGKTAKVSRECIRDLIAIAGGMIIIVLAAVYIAEAVVILGISPAERYDIGLLGWVLVLGISCLVYIVGDSRRVSEGDSVSESSQGFDQPVSVLLSTIILATSSLLVVGEYGIGQASISGSAYLLTVLVLSLIV
ncbi:MAG: hypothetical protein ACE5IO_07450, partial [Thermoplasmata archaeon]